MTHAIQEEGISSSYIGLCAYSYKVAV